MKVEKEVAKVILDYQGINVTSVTLIEEEFGHSLAQVEKKKHRHHKKHHKSHEKILISD